MNAVAAGGGEVDGLDVAISNNIGEAGSPPGFDVYGLGIIRFNGTCVRIFSSASVVAEDIIGTDQDLGNGRFGIEYGTTEGNNSTLLNNDIITDCPVVAGDSDPGEVDAAQTSSVISWKKTT